MKKILVSSIFFLISAIIFSVKYISVSILLAKSDNLDSELIRATFKILPLELTAIYSISFFVGIVFFILGIKEYRRG
ncbi:hypothetical protein JFL43_17130 [Viridibacillus sp. YIM B01967]|uniref:Uncharacterized protein n=1 Tax=Viridibacillus soli TaxID=2798301 RepID=A0ABS1HAW2_9BACL|nr:hypothetical protein [Viridibacillus soli]MBK3496547.1 hypothetical protein [Viridibacillus soli]